MSQQHPFSTPAEAASLYVAGALSPDEQAMFEAHLADCQACAAELQTLTGVAEALALAVSPVEPRKGARESLMAQIENTRMDDPSAGQSQVWKQWTQEPQVDDLLICRAGEGQWEDTDVEGVAVRRLFVDRQADQVTMLVRMAAGSSYPRHVHNGPEECYVLQGELQVGDHVLHAGDYQRAAGGSKHAVQSTAKGCLLLITSSLSDELL